ncbi:hypothetical protein LINGRAHAP2_LOCUS7043, partial [Linum grandiflorum]
MADVMSGRGHGGDGRGNDDDDHRRFAAEKEVTDWYTCTMYDEEWDQSEEKWKVREWMKVLGKIAGLDRLPLGPDSWRAVSDLDKADLWQNLISPKFCWKLEEEKRIQNMSIRMLERSGKSIEERYGRILKGKEKPGRVRHMGFAKTPSVIDWVSTMSDPRKDTFKGCCNLLKEIEVLTNNE